jgi:hypothetical protein
MSLAPEFEKIIRHHRLTGLEHCLHGEELILPHYGGYSIANLPATVAGLLGRELEGAEPPLPDCAWGDLVGGVRNVIVIILDAVGYSHFQRLVDDEDTVFSQLACQGTFVPLTSVFPSTTMAAMSSLWSGRTPGDHGFLGRSLFLPELGVLADMIRLTLASYGRPGALLEWGWVPEEFLAVPDLAQRLEEQGVSTVAHLYAAFVGSGLARLFLRNVSTVIGYVGHSDMWANLRESLAQQPEQPKFVNVYWSATDDIAHTYGPEDERCQAALRQIARSFDEVFWARLPDAARQGTVLIVTSDHGQVETPPERAVHLSDHPALQQMLLLPPAAEPRASWLYVRRGQAEPLRAYVDEHLADRFLLLDMDRAVAAGLFGRTDLPDESRVRLGDMLLLARDDSRLIPEGKSAEDRGEHGGLRPEEMLVPLLMARLDG